MDQTRATIQQLVDTQLASITEPGRRDALSALLVVPECQSRSWDYGAEDERYSCWLVARISEFEIGIVYCERGFGPGNPWGIVSLRDDAMGPDGAWHESLDQAFRNTGYQVP